MTRAGAVFLTAAAIAIAVTQRWRAVLQRGLVSAVLVAGGLPLARADLPALIAAAKPSLVVVGYTRPTSSPRFAMTGTGFAVGDGRWLITNAHVVSGSGVTPVDPQAQLTVQVRAGDNAGLEARAATLAALDTAHDLALLRVAGAPLPALKLATGEGEQGAREGQAVALMGFPLGGALGYAPVTHRGIVSSITPVALPMPTSGQLTAKSIHRLREGSFDVLQLDATAYPGNSGGPLFDADSGEVIGVINMVFVKGTHESALSMPSGISYAIPALHAQRLLAAQAGALPNRRKGG